ncbi:MAG: amidase, partial [Pseudanabaena sp.]
MSLIAQIRQTLINKERSATEVAQEYLDRIDRLEPKLHSFVTVTPEVAIAQAKVIDAAIAAGEELPPLAGIPLGMKDNMCVKGMPTTCGSNMLRNFVPPYEATITTKLRDAGAVMVGKTNLDEFAMGSSTESSAIAQTANPWNTAYVPGGSSGGSAAAVASSECV